jgi:hypothetical protein
MLENYQVSKQLGISQVVLSSMQLVIQNSSTMKCHSLNSLNKRLFTLKGCMNLQSYSDPTKLN